MKGEDHAQYMDLDFPMEIDMIFDDPYLSSAILPMKTISAHHETLFLDPTHEVPSSRTCS